MNDIHENMMSFLICKICEWPFSDTDADKYYEHTIQHTIQNTNSLKCEKCNVKFENQKELLIHLWQDLGMFSCGQCDEKFRDLADLEVHMQRRHSDLDKHSIFKCNECSKQYVTKSNLQRHLIKHNCRKVKVYKCGICEANFNAERYFVVHLRLHENPDLYKCNECSKQFSSSFSLTRHQKGYCIPGPSPSPSIQNSDVKNEFTCDICEADFQEKLHYIEHLTLHNIFKCNECSKRLVNKSSLQRHQKIHIRKKTKEFKCDLCGAEYITKSCFDEHLRLHRNPDLYKCKVCSKKLSCSSNLTEHLKKHRREKESNYY